MSKIKLQLLTKEAYLHFSNLDNLERITKLVLEHDDNHWLEEEFGKKVFDKKKYEIEDFDLEINPETNDKLIDINNAIKLYENLKGLPRYILSEFRFWLWLSLDKFYSQTKSFIKINGTSTLRDHWYIKGSHRRLLAFGTLSRMYFRVELTVDETKEDKYELTRWASEKIERYRNLSWRNLSSYPHLVRGILRGEKRAVEELGEKTSVYKDIAKHVSFIGSAMLLDSITEEDIEGMVYNKMKELLPSGKNDD